MPTAQPSSEKPGTGGMATALSPTSLYAQFDVSPLFEALEVMASQATDAIRPSHGHHGIIDAIPIQTWVAVSSRLVNDEVSTIPAVDLAINLLKRGLPTILENQLLGPSRSDAQPPSYRCLIPAFEDYPISKHVRVRETSDPVLLKEALVGKIVYCLHSYLGAFLARGEDAVQALHYPGNPELKLDLKQRLALGFIRDVVILKRFPSLESFWMTFASMHEEGKCMTGYLDSRNYFEPDQVRQLLSNAPMVYEMYRLLMTISCSNESVVLIHDEMDYYVLNSMVSSIGDSSQMRLHQ